MIPVNAALPREWKKAISMHDESLENLPIQDHHLIKKNQILCLTKLNSNELYWLITVLGGCTDKKNFSSFFIIFIITIITVIFVIIIINIIINNIIII